MLRLLIKHDMKDISKIAVPMFLASGIVSIFCCAVLYFTFGFAEESNSIFDAVMLTGGLYFIGIITMAVMIGIVAVTIMLRYYRSVFADEGHLYMVIPITKRQFLNAKIISSMIWVLLCSVTTGACVVISLFLPTFLYDTSLIAEAFSIVSEELSVGKREMTYFIASLVADILISLISIAKGVMIVITALTVGSVYFKRFRIAISVAIYFGISFLEEAFTVAIKSLVTNVTSSRIWIEFVVNFMLEVFLISFVFITTYLYTLFSLEKKLNLD